MFYMLKYAKNKFYLTTIYSVSSCTRWRKGKILPFLPIFFILKWKTHVPHFYSFSNAFSTLSIFLLQLHKNLISKISYVLLNSVVKFLKCQSPSLSSLFYCLHHTIVFSHCGYRCWGKRAGKLVGPRLVLWQKDIPLKVIEHFKSRGYFPCYPTAWENLWLITKGLLIKIRSWVIDKVT